MYIPAEIENISAFQRDYPIFVERNIRKNPFKLKMRIFMKESIPRVQSLTFSVGNVHPGDQIYDATIICKTNVSIISCPISINISSLLKKVSKRPPVTFDTNELYALVHPEIQNTHFMEHRTPIGAPPILLYDHGFGMQLIDGNHRVVSNKNIGVHETHVIVASADDLRGCLECNDFETIIDIFSDLITFFPKYNMISAIHIPW